jgi:hypothetical protein
MTFHPRTNIKASWLSRITEWFPIAISHRREEDENTYSQTILPKKFREFVSRILKKTRHDPVPRGQQTQTQSRIFPHTGSIHTRDEYKNPNQRQTILPRPVMNLVS